MMFSNWNNIASYTNLPFTSFLKLLMNVFKGPHSYLYPLHSLLCLLLFLHQFLTCSVFHRNLAGFVVAKVGKLLIKYVPQLETNPRT